MTTLPQRIQQADLNPIAISRLVGSEAALARVQHGVSSFDTVFPAGRYVRIPPASVETTHLEASYQGEHSAYMSATVQEYAASYRFVLQDAVVAGQGAVITRQSGLIRESVLEFLAHNKTPDGLETCEMRLRLPNAATRHIKNPCVLVKRPWYRNYGHWLVDGAALTALLSCVSLPTTWQIVVGRQENESMRRVVFDTLAELAPGVPVLEHADDEVWSFSELHYITPVHVPPMYKHPEGLACLRAMLLRASLGGRTGRRIFITRGNGARSLENEAELSDLCLAFDFETLAPEKFSILEQASLFREASCVVGVKGAALANAVFCCSGTDLIVLSPGEFPDPFVYDIAAQRGLRYTEIFGPVSSRVHPRSLNPFTIELKHLATELFRLRSA